METLRPLEIEDQSDGDSRGWGGPSPISMKHHATNILFRAPVTPFELPEVFRIILRYLPLMDLLNCRLVCAAWCRSCSFGRQPSPQNFRMVIPHQQALSELIEGKVWNLIHMKTFENIKLPLSVELRNSIVMQQFLEKFGMHVKNVVLSDGWSVLGLCMLLESCTNLEELHLCGNLPVRLDWVSGRKKFLTLSKLVLKIVNVDVDVDMWAISSVYRFFLDLLSSTPNVSWIQCSTQLDKLRNLKILASIHGRSISDVNDSLYRVNRIVSHILFNSGYVTTTKLASYQVLLTPTVIGMSNLALTNYALRDLYIRITHDCKSGFVNWLPKLSTLKSLHLVVYEEFDVDFSCEGLTELEDMSLKDYTGDLQFLCDIPKLASLILENVKFTKFMKAPTRRSSHSKMRFLSLRHCYFPIRRGQCVKKFYSMFGSAGLEIRL